VTVLVVSSRADATADYLCSRMSDAGIAHARINTEAAPSTCTLLATPDRIELRTGRAILMPAEVRTVWYRRPRPLELETTGDRYDRAFALAEWTAALEGYLAHVPPACWINHPATIMAASSKIEQLRRASQHGLAVPPWLLTLERDRAMGFLREHAHKVVAKPLYCGYIERETLAADTVVYTSRVGMEDLQTATETLGAPTLFQREVVGGVDIRLTILDGEVDAMRLTKEEGDDVDIRRNNMAGVRYAKEWVPAHVKRMVHELVRSYGLRFAAVDMMIAGDEWYFLEINPNGQWAWLDLIGGAQLYELFLNAFRASA
jgi:predicted ATP-grasp superfamily ATP-dependent carboligase